MKSGGLSLPQLICLIILPIGTAIIALGIGRIWVNPIETLQSISGHIGSRDGLSPTVEMVLWNIRLPRILLALLAGAGLSVAGCAFQSLFSNPLATPDTLGVASGAAFGAALGLLLGFQLPGVQAISLLCGLIAITLTMLAGSGKRQGSLNSVVLAGIMIGSLFTALISLVKFTADTENQLPAITYWLMGNLDSAGYDSLLIGAPLIICGIIILYLLRWRLNLLPLSEEEAASTGVNIKALRLITLFCAAGITASCVSMCGQVGWIGLLVPHMCRMAFGNNHLALIPACICVGAAFLVAVDTIARSATAAEIPISILTAIVGAPFFIILMKRTNNWSL